MSVLKVSHLTANFIVAEDEARLLSGSRLPYIREHELIDKAQECARLGITSCKLFVHQAEKTADGRSGLNADNLMVRSIRAFKAAAPQVEIKTEVCACAYSSSGECVQITETGTIDDAATHTYVGKMAVLHAQAGAQTLVAGLTHPGSVRAMRLALDKAGFEDRKLMASVQYRSYFYGPYRAMMNTEPRAGNTFRSHLTPGDKQQTLDWVKACREEGVDEFTLQPVMTNQDSFLLVRAATQKPITAYSVSTELGLICDSGLVWNRANAELMQEYYQSLLRLGADKIMSYVAIEMADWLQTKVN